MNEQTVLRSFNRLLLSNKGNELLIHIIIWKKMCCTKLNKSGPYI